MELLRELHAAGATICMVTHDPRYARSATARSTCSTAACRGEAVVGRTA